LGSTYAQWATTRSDAYCADGIKQLVAERSSGEHAVATTIENLRTTAWRLAIDVQAQASNLETRIAAIERLPSAGRGKAAQIIPIRFVCANKLGRHEKHLLAFDALALSETLGREVLVGKIIHGDDHATVKVKLATLVRDVQKLVEKTAALLANPAPPDLMLNRHCAECEFQTRCRQKAVEKDDLSLLALMTEKERKKFHSKGIFTVTQLSYTFRPRRRPKRKRDKREKYHHALKALAIREKKIYVVGNPELKIKGTLVFLDVEGLPDRDFYYLIGTRISDGDTAVQHSLWASSAADERRIWSEFLAVLATVEKPVLIHYGSYETAFLRRMCERYGGPQKDSTAASAIASAFNILSAIFARVYFPAFSNGLKEIASVLNFTWPEALKGGLEAVACRERWEERPTPEAKQQLTRYNASDCKALELVTKTLLGVQRTKPDAAMAAGQEVVDVTLMKREHPYGFKLNDWVFPELDAINKAAYWDYQRARVYVRSNRRIRDVLLRKRHHARTIPPNRIIQCSRPQRCPKCDSARIEKHMKLSKLVYNLKFTSGGVKRWVVHYYFHRYKCQDCDHTFNPPERDWSRSRYGSDLIAYSIYQIIELGVPTENVNTSLNRLFGLQLPAGTAHRFKADAAEAYVETYEALLARLTAGSLIHADETRISVDGRDAFVWVFTSMEEVAYIFTETREAEFVHTLLANFKGVLVSDFFAGYEGLPCAQQKCLVHLIRDLNDALHKHPFDDELTRLARRFTSLLQPMVKTVDRFGLKSRFLKRHCASVAHFYKELLTDKLESDVAAKFRTRLEKHRQHLFTFLVHDGVPWNNNNAEHAIKPFAKLRHVIDGLTSEKGIRNYLVLLSVCQTCKYMGVDFLDFLRSGEKDVHAFAESRQNRQTAEPTSVVQRQ